MPRGKRPYVPKTKGCYECSQRRIHCDRTEPSCIKCAGKGIRCSGFGIRYRFNADVVSKKKASEDRGRWFQHQITTKSSDDSNSPASETNNESSSDENLTRDTREKSCIVVQCPTPPSQAENEGLDELLRAIEIECEEADFEEIVFPSTIDPLFEFEDDDVVNLETTALGTLEPWKQQLTVYFSDRIATEMVVIDDERNGWRNLVLPIAHHDELVMDAVVSAAAFHFSANVSGQLFNPSSIYQRAIRRLQQRQQLNPQDTEGTQCVLLSLLVLLSAVILNGYSDFRDIFRLIDTALDAVGGEKILLKGELGRFLSRQFRKFRGYVAAFLSEEKGLAQYTQTSLMRPSVSKGWDDFRTYYDMYPEFEDSLSTIYDLNEVSCGIYVARAQAGPSAPALTDEVTKFKATMEKLPFDFMGNHILVNSVFTVALESTTPEEQTYFTEFLLAQQKRNGFANIPKAIEFLEDAWMRHTMGGKRDWTRRLTEFPVFIV